MLDEDSLSSLLRIIIARAWGKPTIPLEDVIAVLDRKESGGDRERGVDSSEDSSEEDRSLDDLSEHEKVIKDHMIKPGQSTRSNFRSQMS